MTEKPNPCAWRLTDLEKVRPNGFKVFSTFACGGGSSMGYKLAGYDVVAANDIDDEMAEHYKKNLRPRLYYQCPIGDLVAKNEDGSWKVALDPELEEIDVLDGSPPCFPAGTPITTMRGLVPIEQVGIGDKVLTHRGEWRAVNEVFVNPHRNPLVTIQAKYGRLPVTATANHPFFVRRRLSNRYGRKVYAEPAWVEAGQIAPGDMLLEPRVWGTASFEPPMVATRTSRGKKLSRRAPRAELHLSQDIAWVLGLYIAEGHRRGRDPDQETPGPCRREVIFSLHQDEAAHVCAMLARAGYHGMVSPATGKGCRVAVSSPDLWELCAEFGDGAAHKRIPAWVWPKSDEWLRHLLDGYVYGDGYETAGANARGRTNSRVVSCSTVSADLGRDLMTLVPRVCGVVPCLGITPEKQGTIQGRSVACKQVWVVRFNRSGSAVQRMGFVDEAGAWVPVAEVTRGAERPTTVYNFGVEGHHTYVAAGFAVHNCSTFSMSGSREKAWGKKKEFREGQAKQVLSDLFYEYLDLVGRLRPKVSIAENVPGMLLGNAKGYVRGIFARYRSLGYRPQLFYVNAADAGVPQARRRVFFLAVREDLAAAAELPPLALDFRHRHVSSSEACADVQNLTAEEVADTEPHDCDLKWWAVTRPGEKYANALRRASLSPSMWNWIRHPAHRPACTLVAAHQCMKHWAVCRGLTLREYIRLGSFPDDYQARTADRGKYLIGMSVPPRLAEAVARAVATQWLEPLAAAKPKRKRAAGT